MDSMRSPSPCLPTIFRRFQGRRPDWIYQFPKPYVVDPRPLKEALDEK